MRINELLSFAGVADETEINGFTADSRAVKPGMAFICIAGTKSDGHDYAACALKDGAAVVICQRDLGLEHQILVSDTRSCYAEMSANYFGRPADRIHLIGVTGTNGKTSVTYMLKHILEAAGKKVGLIGTIQNMIGDEPVHTEHTTPDCFELNSLFAKMADAGCEYVVMEVSSHALDQKRVYHLHFDVAVFTNLTQDHLDYHHTMENYLAAKKKLFSMCDTAVVNTDDGYASELMKGLSCKIVTLSASRTDSDYYSLGISYASDGIRYRLCGKQNAEIALKTGGKFSVYNSMCAAVAAFQCGFSPNTVTKALAGLNGVKGRAEVVPNSLGFTVIIDYAHTPDGLKNILSAFRECNPEHLTVLFGCGGDRDKTKRPIMGKIAASLADEMMITSDNPRSEEPMSIIGDILAGIKDTKTPYTVIENRVEAIHHAIATAHKGDVIILAGKGHEDYQVLKNGKIHLDEREVVADALKNRGGTI